MNSYLLSCQCGARVGVKLSRAGGEVSCPDCEESLQVPRLSKLKNTFSVQSKPEPGQFVGYEDFEQKSTLACLLLLPILLFTLTFNVDGTIIEKLGYPLLLSAYLLIPYAIYRKQMRKGRVGLMPLLIFFFTTGVVPGICLALTWDAVRYTTLKLLRYDGTINYSITATRALLLARP